MPKEPDGTESAYTYGEAVEVRIARQTALRRKTLRERHLKACNALGAEPLAQDAWDALWPQRVLFRQDFEAAGDWDGQVAADNTPPGSKFFGAGKPVDGEARLMVDVVVLVGLD